MAITLQKSLTGFSFPEDIAIRNDGIRVAIVNTNAHQVKWTDLPSTTYTLFGNYFNGYGNGFAFPESIVFDSAGNILVLDLWNKRIVKYTDNGNNYVYDTTFSLSNGLFVDGISLGHPRDMVIDNNDNLYILDGDNRRVILFDGVNSSSIPLPNILLNPYGLALRPSGGFLIVDRDNHKIYAINSNGAIDFSIGNFGQAPGQLKYPEHGVYAPNGNIWIADTDNQRIQEFGPDGKFIRVVIKTEIFREIRRLRFSPDNSLYVVDSGAGAVHILSDAIPTQYLQIQKSSLNFGKTGIGYTLALPLELRNIGLTNVHVTNILPTSAYGIDLCGISLPLLIPPDGSKTIYVTFIPTSVSITNGLLRVESDAIQNLQDVSLTGEGVQAPSVSVVLVLDRSGSMGEQYGNTTKISALRSAVSLLVNLLRKDYGDTIGIVSFNQTSRVDLILTPVTANNVPNIVATVQNSITASGSTSIGAGLLDGLNMLNQSSLNTKVLVVLTDGMENFSPYIKDIMIPSDVKVYAIGIGNDNEVDFAKLATLTTITGGTLMASNQNTNLISKFFVQIAADLFDQFILTDPNYTISLSRNPVEIYIPVVNSDKSFRCVVMWDDPQKYLLTEILTPSGLILQPRQLSEKINLPGASILKINLPFKKKFGSTTESAGNWKLVLKPGPRWTTNDQVQATVSIIVDSNLRLNVNPTPPLFQRTLNYSINNNDVILPYFFVGDPLMLDVKLTDRGIPLEQISDDRSYIEKPVFGIDGILKYVKLNHDVVNLIQSQDRVNLSALNNIMKIHFKEKSKHMHKLALKIFQDYAKLNDHSNNTLSQFVSLLSGKLSKSKNKFTVKSSITCNPSVFPTSKNKTAFGGIATNSGVHTFTIKVKVKNLDGHISSRERTISIYVYPEISMTHSDLRVIQRTDVKKPITWKVTILPRDRFGRPLGPGWGEIIKSTGESIKSTPIIDNGDGRYSFEFHTVFSEHSDIHQLFLQLGQYKTPLILPPLQSIHEEYVNKADVGIKIPKFPSRNNAYLKKNHHMNSKTISMKK